MSTNYHPGCFKIPRKFAKLSPAEFVDEHVTDATDDNSLLPDRKDEIVGQIEAAMASTSAKKKKETPGVDEDKGLMARLKARYETWKENGSDERPKKKSKKSGGKKEEGDADDEEIVRMLPVYDDLKDKKLPELKDILRYVLLHSKCESYEKINRKLTSCLILLCRYSCLLFRRAQLEQASHDWYPGLPHVQGDRWPDEWSFGCLRS